MALRVIKAQQLSRGVIRTIAGMAVTTPYDFIKLAAHAGDELLKRQFSQALADSYIFWLNKGEIDPKYFDSTKFADLAPEFASIVDSKFGVDKLNHLRKIFINLAKDNGENSYKKYLLDIALKMSEIEIKVLLADYNFLRNGGTFIRTPNNILNKVEWVRQIAQASGLRYDNLVLEADKKLNERGLFRGYLYSDNSGVAYDDTIGRLTDMGHELCVLLQLDE